MVAGALATACAPSEAPEFVGDYISVRSVYFCRTDHPEAPSGVGHVSFELTIEEGDDGNPSLALPMPPCPLEARVEGEELRLGMIDCVEVNEPGVSEVEYTHGSGVGRWADGHLHIDFESARQYLVYPEGLPDWYGNPGSCSASYELEPVDEPIP